MDGRRSDALAVALAEYQARTPAEVADLERVRTVAGQPDPWDRSTPLHVTASALIVHPPTGRILLCWHDRQQAWLQVGGHADPGEVDPLAVALRGGAEETGLPDLRPWPSPAVRHVVIVAVPAAGPEPAHHHADVRFVVATERPELIRPERPTAELRWLSAARAAGLTTEDNVRDTIGRARALLKASPDR